ncbi:MAG: hypothetical protein WB995_05725, partial [Candidatus Acidiferrales bacterium]
ASNDRMVVRWQREVYLWRFVFLLAVAGSLSAASPQIQKEIRFKSDDGRNTVILSAEGLTLEASGNPLARLTFETVGDGEKQMAILKIRGEVAMESGVITLADGKQRSAVRADGFSLTEGGIQQASIAPGLVSVADSTGHAKAQLSADNRGLSNLVLLYNQNVIAELGSFGNFRVEDPLKRDSAALMLNDFGSNSKSRLITPSEDTTRGKQ